MGNFALDPGYVDVAARIVEFRGKHPDCSLQPVDPANPFTVQAIGDKTFIVVTAAAYRTPDDQRPGIGMAWEPFPGRTPYTRDSELQNAETSAWGRAIVAAMAADTKRGIASAEEVRNRGAERDQDGPQRRPESNGSADQAPSTGLTGPAQQLAERMNPAERLRKSVKYTLEAATLEEAEGRLTKLAKASDLQGQKIGDVIDQESAEKLGLDDAKRSTATMLELAELVCGYLQRHHVPVIEQATTAAAS